MISLYFGGNKTKINTKNGNTIFKNTKITEIENNFLVLITCLLYISINYKENKGDKLFMGPRKNFLLKCRVEISLFFFFFFFNLAFIYHSFFFFLHASKNVLMHFLFLFAHSFFIPFYMRAIINYTLDGLFMKYELMSIYVKKKKKPMKT